MAVVTVLGVVGPAFYFLYGIEKEENSKTRPYQIRAYAIISIAIFVMFGIRLFFCPVPS